MSRRLWLALLTLTIALLVGGIVLWLLNRPTRPLPPTLPVDQPPAPVVRQASPVPEEDIAAWINRNPVPRAALMQRQAVDRALNTLLGLPTDDEATSLDRLLNEALVVQAAQAAGFTVSPEFALAERNALLAAYGKSEAELDAALQAEDLSLTAFDAYFMQLLTVRDFTAIQAAAQGITSEAYILGLREANDVQIAARGMAAASTATIPPEPPATLPPTLAPTATPTPLPTPDEPRGVANGQRAPDFTLTTLEGNSLTLDALLGQPVVLSFWVTWCGHCRAQTPLLVDAHTRYGADVHFVGVNVREAQDAVQSYMTGQGIAYPIVLDADGAIAQLYQISGFPTTYFLNAEGRIVARQIGQLNPQIFDQYLDLAQQ